MHNSILKGDCMSWDCTLYSGFNKKLNSTRQPSGGTVYPCLIKKDTDFKNPILEIQASDLSGVNYMKFNGEYFYVTSLISHRTGIWEVAGQRDPMATYKAQIGSTSGFMLYGGGDDVSDAARRVPDERLAVARVPQISKVDADFSGSFQFNRSGSFLLSAVGESGGVASFIVSLGGMRSILNGLGQDTMTRLSQTFNVYAAPGDETAALTDIRNGLWDALSKELAYGSYAEAIKSCVWIPFSGFTGDQGIIYLGDYNTGVGGTIVGAGGTKTAFADLAIPWPAEDWKRNNCQVMVYLPMSGVVALPVDKINGATDVFITASLDAVGGNIAYSLTVDGQIYEVSGANAAAPYAVGSSNITPQNFMSGVSNIVGGGINAATGALTAALTGGLIGGGGIGGGITSMASGIVQAVTPTVTSVGGMGGIAGVGLQIYASLYLLYYPPIDEAGVEGLYGHPVFSVSTPTAGYNMFRAFSVGCNGTPDEIATINTYFNQGAFYE